MLDAYVNGSMKLCFDNYLTDYRIHTVAYMGGF